MVKIKKQRRVPLDIQISNDHIVKSKKNPRQKYLEREKRREEKEEEILDKKTSQRILEIAEEQIKEEEEENNVGDGYTEEEQDNEEESEKEEESYYEEEEEEEEMNEEDKKTLEAFMRPRVEMDLAGTIMKKIKEKERKTVKEKQSVNPKIAQVFQKVGEILGRYRSGKLPKAFKILPTLKNWEEILLLTSPDKWTPNATFETTSIFVSNLKPIQAEQYLTNFLLPIVRNDLMDNGNNKKKTLNVHLYNSLTKALYKPSAWFKGILFPLLEEGCTLKEAAIIGSVLSKASVPVLHSSAALLKITELEYSGASSIFIRVLLDKKYALPFKVIDSLVQYFIRVKVDKEGKKYPVLWHQSLLVFVQRYKQDLNEQQRGTLMDLVNNFQYHEGISPEIKRELSCSEFEMKDVEKMMDIEQALMNY